MGNITIIVSDLSKELWSLTKLFAENVLNGKSIDHKRFQKLLEKSIDVVIETNKREKISLKKEYDINSILNSTDNQPQIIIKYIKKDARRDFTELIPFFYISKYVEIIFYLDISNVIDKESRDRYYFSCSQFFHYITENDNIKAKNRIYVIDKIEKVDIQTGEIVEHSYEKRLAQKSRGNLSTIFSPLIEITETNKRLLFDGNTLSNSNDYLEYVRKQFNKEKINATIRRKINSIEFRNFFSEIFIKSFLIHLESIDHLTLSKNLEGNISLLNSYCDNIKELVENVIFHTEHKKGFFFFVFNKLEDIAESKKEYFLDEKDNILRLIEICIYDFNDTGILDTFSEQRNNHISLEDFFNIESVITTDLTHLELRYTAHLGLKSFAKSIVRNKGHFYLETNNSTKKNKSVLNYYNNEIHVTESENNCNIINGTHYEITLPFSPLLITYTQDNLISFQAKSFTDIYKKWLLDPKQSQIKTISMRQLLPDSEPPSITNKEEQINFVKEIGNHILASYSDDREVIAFDYQEFPAFIDNNLLFKVLAFIQLKRKDYFKLIILHNASKAFVESIKEIIQMFLPDNKADLWNDNAALVLITKNLNYYIIGGKTGKQINEYNKAIRMYYPIGHDNIEFHFPEKIGSDSNKIRQEYILPYDLLVKNDEFIFEKYVADILENDIEDVKIGYKLNSDYTKLGSKIITKFFFEADTLFQNSFFVDRFAYLISMQLSENLNGSKKKLAIIGYGQYSELLLNTIKRIFKDKEGKDKVHAFIIAKDANNNIDWSFESNTKDDICENVSDYIFAIIVPIGSTTTTNDKIIASFKQYIKFACQNEIEDDQFIYNCSAILVRDNDNLVNETTRITDAERKIDWTSISGKVVETGFGNRVGKTHFIVSKNGEWFFPINPTISFPVNFWEEKSVNLTKSSSLNSQRLIGFPKVKDIHPNVFNDTLKRLNDLKDFISAGHIRKEKSHHRYYVDTERFVKKNCESYTKWLEDVRTRLNVEKRQLNLLVTPSTNIESDLIKTVNEKIFNNAGLIIYIDIEEDYRNNIVHKYSFLKTLDKDSLSIHFIDHALLTGESVKKARSYISSIFGMNMPFSSIIALVNRLSYDRDKESNGYKKDIVYSYVTLFVPPSKDPEKDCSICASIKHYENNIIKHSSLDSCHMAAKRKVSKIQETNYDKDGDKELSNREFDRFILTHQLFFEISKLVHQNETKYNIVAKLNDIFLKQKNKGDEDRITFVKVLSSHPLSHYMHIKDYIHSLSLNELKDVLSKKESPHIIDFRYLLVLLKQLSELGSNALIRQNVIIDVWEFYFNLCQQNRVNEDIQRILNSIQNQEKIIQGTEVKIRLQEKKILEEEKQQGELPFAINELRRELEELKTKSKQFYKENEHLKKEKTTIEYNVSHFKDLFALYIKNITYNDESKSFWIGELLRRGKEIDNFDTILTSPNIENNPIFSHFNGKSNDLTKCYIESLGEVFKFNYQSIADEKINEDVQRLKPEFFEIDNGIDKLKGYREINKSSIHELLNAIIARYCIKAEDDAVSNFINLLYSKLDELNRYYKDFLMQVFYDNTTIIRKTIENFEKEIYKDEKLKKKFFSDVNLIPYKDIDRGGIEELLRRIVGAEYYYRNAREYIESEHNIGLFENLIDLLYIKLLISSYQENENKNNDIIQKITPILEILSNIMMSDEAHFVIANSGENFASNSKFYNIAQYNKGTKKRQEIQTVKEGSYIYRTLRKGTWTYPLVVRNNVSMFDEGKLGYKALNMLIVHEPLLETSQFMREEEIPVPVGCICFLYNEEIKKIISQEKGRLVLIIRSLINEYIDSLLNREIVNDWIEKTLNQQKHKKIYSENDHFINDKVYPAIEHADKILKTIKLPQFANINDINFTSDIDQQYLEVLDNLAHTYYVLSNNIITHIYSCIEQNKIFREDNPKKVPLRDVFNDRFYILLKRMADKLFAMNSDRLIIVDNIQNREKDIILNKYRLQTFIIQCVQNVVKHLYSSQKTTYITIDDNNVVISNDMIGVDPSRLIDEKKYFEIIAPSIKQLQCDEYSHTTLTSLQGYVSNRTECDFGFEEDNMFFVKIKI